MSNSDNPGNSSYKSLRIPISSETHPSLLKFYQQQKELVAKLAPLSTGFGPALELRKLTETVRKYQENMPKINPELVQALTKLSAQSSLLQVSPAVMETMSKIREINKRLASIAGTDGLATSIDFNRRLWEAATGASILSTKVAEALENVARTGRWVSTSTFELDGETFDVAAFDFEEVLDTPSAPASSLVVEESGRVKRIITDILQDDKRLLSLEPRAFEEVIAELLRYQGFAVELTKQTRDGGYDLIAIGVQAGFPLKFLVECKRYHNKKKIGIEIVRGFMQVVQQEHANKGIIATTSYFSQVAHEEQKKVHGYKLDLRDQSDILSWIQKYGESILHLRPPNS
jgi:hypothetical protein